MLQEGYYPCSIDFVLGHSSLVTQREFGAPRRGAMGHATPDGWSGGKLENLSADELRQAYDGGPEVLNEVVTGAC